jgi:hypothetical protein
MLCNSVMKPALIFSGILVSGLSLIGLAVAYRSEEPSQI